MNAKCGWPFWQWGEARRRNGARQGDVENPIPGPESPSLTLVGHALLLRGVGLDVDNVTDPVVDEVGGEVGCAVLCIRQSNPAHAEVLHRQGPPATTTRRITPSQNGHDETKHRRATTIAPGRSYDGSERMSPSRKIRGEGWIEHRVKRSISSEEEHPSAPLLCPLRGRLLTLEVALEHVARTRPHTEGVRHFVGLERSVQTSMVEQ